MTLLHARQLLAFSTVLWTLSAAGAEVDNYSTQGYQPSEAIDSMNESINQQLQAVIEDWGDKPEDSRQFTARAYQRLKTEFLDDWGTSWYHTRQISYYKVSGHIYSGLHDLISLGTKIIPPSIVIHLNGTPIGTDKVTHFLSLGYRMYRHGYDRGEKAAIRFAHLTERTFLGTGVIGVYSNADMVANYEGYLFFRALTEEGVVPGKAAVIRWENSRPVQQRQVDLRDHINSYWNEAMNPSWYVPWVRKKISKKLPMYCELFRVRPELYIPVDAEMLDRKYAVLPLRSNLGNRLENVCNEDRL